MNTADSRVALSFDVARSAAVPPWLRYRILCNLRGRLARGVLTITASEHRSQLQNRTAARERMGRILRDAAAALPDPQADDAVARGEGTPNRRQEASRPDQAASPRRDWD